MIDRNPLFAQIPQDMTMKIATIKLLGLSAAIALSLCTFGASAEDSKIEAPYNKDQVKGRVDEAQGKAKEEVGKVLDDKGMEIEGNIQKNTGKVQKGIGDIKQDIKENK